MSKATPLPSFPAMPLTGSINFRLATETDLPKLEWGGEFAHFRRMMLQTYRDQKSGLRAFVVAEWNNYPIGQICILFNEPNNLFHNHHNRGYIYAFRVMTPFQGLGIGTALIHQAETLLIARQYTGVILSVAQNNERARQLYERLGYSIYGEDEGLWNYIDQHGKRVQVHEPCWLLAKDLSSP